VLWLIVGLLTILVAALVWRMGGTPQTPPVQVAAAPLPSPIRPAEAVAPAPVTPPSAVPATTPNVAAPAAIPSKTGPLPKAEPAAKPGAKEKMAVAAPAVKGASAAAGTPKAETKVAAKAGAPKAGASAADTTTAETRVYTLGELPDDIQRDLPKLTISGGTYSANPAQRLLIVNNQVFLEGSQPVPGLTVEQIRQNAAVLSFRGYRYRVAY
jgi:general secretion pathway protein B